jgi:hypothetical protein
MAEALRRDCDPMLLGLGFRNPHRMDNDRWHTTRRNTFLRWRGTDYDEVAFQWDKYGRPKFFLNFWTSRVEQPPANGKAALRAFRGGIMRSWQGPLRVLHGGWFGPWMAIETVTALVNWRILQLNDFLVNGVIGPQVSVGPPRLRGPDDGEDRVPPVMKIWGDPWLDPESDYVEKSTEPPQRPD